MLCRHQQAHFLPAVGSRAGAASGWAEKLPFVPRVNANTAPVGNTCTVSLQAPWRRAVSHTFDVLFSTPISDRDRMILGKTARRLRSDAKFNCANYSAAPGIVLA
jgi:hypothetical protein